MKACCAVPISSGPISLTISTIIQIRWKFRFAPIQVLLKRSLQIFARDTTAVLSSHEQNFGATWCAHIVLHWSDFPSNLKYERKIVSEMDPLSVFSLITAIQTEAFDVETLSLLEVSGQCREPVITFYCNMPQIENTAANFKSLIALEVKQKLCYWQEWSQKRVLI